MKFRTFVLTYLCRLTLALTACATKPIPTQPHQPPEEYLSNALDWIETHSLKVNTVDWPAVRAQALAMAAHPQSTADTYPAILFVLKELGDSVMYFFEPDQLSGDYAGFGALYPDAVIIGVDPGGPADRAGLHTGDVIEAINGEPPRQWQGTRFLDLPDSLIFQMTVRRAGQVDPIEVSLERIVFEGFEPKGRLISTDQGNLGYIELAVTGGWDQYPTLAQQVIQEADQAGACGWIIDLRRNVSGDLWSYIAAIGPILGEGEIGGFVYLDGTRESWKYQDGKVFWAGNERWESLVEGPVYKLKRATPPVAVLVSNATLAAGELAAVAFQGRPKTRTFGEPTGGSPFLSYWTGLSDRAWLGVSGAFSIDRTGRVYEGSIKPDQIVTMDWRQINTDQDPILLVAQDWLFRQPDCAQK